MNENAQKPLVFQTFLLKVQKTLGKVQKTKKTQKTQSFRQLKGGGGLNRLKLWIFLVF